MSKELETLIEIILELCHYRNTDENAICKCEINKQKCDNCSQCPLFKKGKVIEKELNALQIVKEIAKSYNIEFCDKDQSISFELPYRNIFILERITFEDKKKYDLLKEVLL